ncbi:hypothetical protein PGIGA_G00198060 [Pangasianodon gigas]|uniref:Uncharacterized protein n=1 Tax=Pangasianodon gigas TaxID=30993 RepID=A0ACC5WDT4_PANGG|nr:hypothetical protein [Pangasianodon gigas]
MQRLCVTLCGLLASCLCSWGSSESFSVVQSPSTLTLRKGEEVRITCSWNISITGAKVKWFKDKLEFNKTETHKNDKSLTLVINDAGFYICEVTQDVPQLVKVNGTGTNVTYKREHDNETCTTQRNSPTSPQSTAEPSVTAVGASVSAVILSICVCLSVWRMKRGCRKSERTVIREGPPSEGDEPENSEDGDSSRTSRGSTQWYMVPVYESYFDLQRSDEQQCADSDKATCASALK